MEEACKHGQREGRNANNFTLEIQNSDRKVNKLANSNKSGQLLGYTMPESFYSLRASLANYLVTPRHSHSTHPTVIYS